MSDILLVTYRNRLKGGYDPRDGMFLVHRSLHDASIGKYFEDKNPDGTVYVRGSYGDKNFYAISLEESEAIKLMYDVTPDADNPYTRMTALRGGDYVYLLGVDVLAAVRTTAQGSAEIFLDKNKRRIRLGDWVVYPVRSGSDMWLVEEQVLELPSVTGTTFSGGCNAPHSTGRKKYSPMKLTHGKRFSNWEKCVSRGTP
jgi:hypothetical protein